MVDVAPSRQASFAANQALWDVWTQIHATGAFYDLEGLRTSGVRLRPYEIEMVGDVVGTVGRAGDRRRHLTRRDRAWVPGSPLHYRWDCKANIGA